jgi:hypothetical protein
LLAPKRADNYDSLLGLYAYLEDAGGLKRLKQRIEDVDPDVARQRQVAIEFVQGKEREDRRKAMIGAETNCRQLYDRWQAEPASAKRDRSLAIAAGQLAAFACARQALDDRVDINEAVKFAEEGVGLVPSTGGRHRLFYALQARAHEELAAKDSEYGRFAASARSVLPPSLTLIMALDHQTLRSAILEHPDVRRTAELYIEERQKFPQTPSTWDWFLLRHTHAERAESLRAAALADECQRLSSEIQVLLYPFSVNAVCQQYARLRCASEDSKARQLWAALRETGIPVTDEILPP